jgi:hypothetical protein
VWVYRRACDAFLTNTGNVFVERDFYGKDSSVLDDAISASEAQFATLIKALRAPNYASPIDPELAGQLIAALCARSNWLRRCATQVFRAAARQVIGELHEPDGAIRLLRQVMRATPTWLEDKFIAFAEDRKDAPLTNAEMTEVRALAQAVERNLDKLTDILNTDQLASPLHKLEAMSGSIVSDGHNTALLKTRGWQPTWESLRSYRWYVQSQGDAYYILGDCGPLFCDENTGDARPVGTLAASAPNAVVLPISPIALLRGSDQAQSPPTSPNVINGAMARWSVDTFIASKRSPSEEALHVQIGEDFRTYVDELLRPQTE